MLTKYDSWEYGNMCTSLNQWFQVSTYPKHAKVTGLSQGALHGCESLLGHRLCATSKDQTLAYMHICICIYIYIDNIYIYIYIYIYRIVYIYIIYTSKPGCCSIEEQYVNNKPLTFKHTPKPKRFGLSRPQNLGHAEAAETQEKVVPKSIPQDQQADV